jgi:hypothetical protein
MNAFRAAALVVACLPALLGAAGLAQTRRVYVTAVDGNGVPVTDLTAADFTVKEGGKEREIVKTGPATGPLQTPASSGTRSASSSSRCSGGRSSGSAR